MAFLSKLVEEAALFAMSAAFEEQNLKVQEPIESHRPFGDRIVIKEMQLDRCERKSGDINRFEVFGGEGRLLFSVYRRGDSVSIDSPDGNEAARIHRHETTWDVFYSLKLKKDDRVNEKKKFGLFRDDWTTFELKEVREWNSIDNFKKNITGVTFRLEDLDWTVRYEPIAYDLRQEGCEIKRGDTPIALLRSSYAVEGDYTKAVFFDYEDSGNTVLVTLMALVLAITWD